MQPFTSLQEKLTQDAQRFLRDEVNPRRDADNMRRFKTNTAQVRESTVVIAPKKLEQPPPENEETLFSPNSNGQGI